MPKKLNKSWFIKDLHYLWYVAILLVLLVVIWILPIEEKANFINNPNQKAATSFVGSDWAINVDGGFLYRLDNYKQSIPSQITIKQSQPVSLVNIKSNKKAKLRLNILNTSHDSNIYFNGKPQKIEFYPVNTELKQQLSSNDLPDYKVVKSSKYLDEKKGAYLDIELTPGTNNIFISPANNSDQLRFTVASDFHSGYSVGFNGFLKMIQSRPDFIILNGDIVDFGNKAEYIVINGFTEASPIPFYATIGNHENWQNGSKFYLNYFGPLTKSFTFKNSLFIFLDNHTGYISDSQFKWLEGELSKSKALHKFVFAHMPAIDAHTEVFDTKNYRYPQMKHNMYSKNQSDKLINLISRYQVDALFSGHDHIFNNFNIGNTNQVNSGAIGGKIRKVDEVTYLDVQIDGKNVDIKNIPLAGSTNVYNQEHASKLKLVSMFAKPYISDKKLRLLISVAIIILFIALIVRSKYSKHPKPRKSIKK